MNNFLPYNSKNDEDFSISINDNIDFVKYFLALSYFKENKFSTLASSNIFNSSLA